MSILDQYGVLGDTARADEWAQDHVREILATQIRDAESTAQSYAAVGLKLEAARLRAVMVHLGRLIPQVGQVPPLLATAPDSPPATSAYDHRPVVPQIGRELP